MALDLLCIAGTLGPGVVVFGFVAWKWSSPPLRILFVFLQLVSLIGTVAATWGSLAADAVPLIFPVFLLDLSRCGVSDASSLLFRLSLPLLWALLLLPVTAIKCMLLSMRLKSSSRDRVVAISPYAGRDDNTDREQLSRMVRVIWARLPCLCNLSLIPMASAGSSVMLCVFGNQYGSACTDAMWLPVAALSGVDLLLFFAAFLAFRVTLNSKYEKPLDIEMVGGRGRFRRISSTTLLLEPEDVVLHLLSDSFRPGYKAGFVSNMRPRLLLAMLAPMDELLSPWLYHLILVVLLDFSLVTSLWAQPYRSKSVNALEGFTWMACSTLLMTSLTDATGDILLRDYVVLSGVMIVTLTAVALAMRRGKSKGSGSKLGHDTESGAADSMLRLKKDVSADPDVNHAVKNRVAVRFNDTGAERAFEQWLHAVSPEEKRLYQEYLNSVYEQEPPEQALAMQQRARARRRQSISHSMASPPPVTSSLPGAATTVASPPSTSRHSIDENGGRPERRRRNSILVSPTNPIDPRLSTGAAPPAAVPGMPGAAGGRRASAVEQAQLRGALGNRRSNISKGAGNARLIEALRKVDEQKMQPAPAMTDLAVMSGAVRRARMKAQNRELGDGMRHLGDVPATMSEAQDAKAKWRRAVVVAAQQAREEGL